MFGDPKEVLGNDHDCKASAWNWWQGLVNFERRQPSFEELKLQRISDILGLLENPHLKLKCLHVAGTKGKGSVCAFLDSILRHGNQGVGLFTSPHLETINERFTVNGIPISTDDLLSRIWEVSKAAKTIGGEPPTFFEVATAAAFLHFRNSKIDWGILETGLGGRLDSTNVCVPIGCAITSISLDHTKQLGDTVEKIAGEKAGILKKGIPAVSGVREHGPREVIRRHAREVEAPLWELDNEIRIINQKLIEDTKNPGLWKFDLITPKSFHRDLIPNLPGKHQIDNAALAIGLLDQLNISPEELAIKSGVRLVQWPCRIQTINEKPWVILDTAHNVASIKALTESIFFSRPHGTTHLVFAASQDKDTQGMLAHLADFFDKIYLTRYLGGLRATPPENLYESVPKKHQAIAKIYENPIKCLESILENTSPLDLVCITGSVFLAGELKPWLNKRFSTGVNC